MSEMVERVANAIRLEDRENGSEASDPGSGYYKSLARAAIAAMRDPTDEMVNKGLYDAEDFNLLGTSTDRLAEAYRRMIDAALAGSKHD